MGNKAFSSKREETKKPENKKIAQKEKEKNPNKEEAKIEKEATKEEFNFDSSKYVLSTKKKLTMNDSYLVKNIEKEYIDIESEIKQICLDKNDDEEQIENEVLGKYLYKLKGIALNAKELAEKLTNILFKEFKKVKKEFANLKVNTDPGCIVEFSSWTKNSLIDEKKFLKDFCEKNKKNEYNEEDYNLYLKLTEIYFHCLACSEEIEFKSLKKSEIDGDFNKEEMFDLAQIRGTKKKVNFEVLPGLYYNKQYFEKGKKHVFAYIPEKTYKHNIKNNK